MQARSQFSAAAVHLGGTHWHRCGSAMLAERLQLETAPEELLEADFSATDDAGGVAR
jgi:hypothetical protein